jgi:D-beta-D-heptose 7-phosphate kinase/D-beta-D-heptose 1-phosphate adenosyltransferase
MTETTDHLAALERFPGMRILCIGDVMLDCYVHGSVTRISPEAPIPILRIERESLALGGVGNVANNVFGLGGVSLLATVAGEDAAATNLAGLLAEIGGCNGLVVDAGRPTTLKTRYVSGSQQLLRADQEVTRAIAPAIEEALIARIHAMAEGARAIVISDYLKGVVTPRIAAAAIAAGKRGGMPVVVDSKPASYRYFTGATLLKPNRRELQTATGLPVDTDDEVVAAARALIALSGVDCIVATRSEQGMSVICASGEAVHFRAEAKEVFDVSGAGDTVAATLAMALASGSPLVEAAELANHAAGIVVGKIGTAPVRLSELREAIEAEPEHASRKVKTVEDAVDEAERWRARGVRVGFTNGCFDLIHPGHISLLAQARRACDRLIVGLNSDASVRRLKGETRPVQDQTARAAVLAALEDVDAVVIFDEDTPQEIIHRLAPDVLVKGADYTIETVVGAEFVIARGGRVVLADLKQGHSTTGMIGRMRG